MNSLINPTTTFFDSLTAVTIPNYYIMEALMRDIIFSVVVVEQITLGYEHAAVVHKCTVAIVRGGREPAMVIAILENKLLG